MSGSYAGRVGERKRMSQAEFAEMVHAKLMAAIEDDTLSEVQLRAILALLEPAVERAKHGGPTGAQIEKN